jgi:hypothetical protein
MNKNQEGTMKPSDKSPQITRFLEAAFGRTTAIESLKCVRKPVGCGRAIDPGEIEVWDAVTRREYTISDLCKTCQDEVFGS